MPTAARLHSAGRVLIAAGNQRASIDGRSIKNGQKKGLSGFPEKPFKTVPAFGGGTRAVCQSDKVAANAY
jgi:hypothetical protein